MDVLLLVLRKAVGFSSLSFFPATWVSTPLTELLPLEPRRNVAPPRVSWRFSGIALCPLHPGGDVDQVVAKQIVQATLDAMIEGLAKEGRLELRGFGILEAWTASAPAPAHHRTVQ